MDWLRDLVPLEYHPHAFWIGVFMMLIPLAELGIRQVEWWKQIPTWLKVASFCAVVAVSWIAIPDKWMVPRVGYAG